MDTCKLIEVIETTLLRRGDGTANNPTRIVTQYWTKDGLLITEKDPYHITILYSELKKRGILHDK